MIAGLKPYPTMKDSGVEWLGEVPSYWEVLPSRAIFTEVKERDRPGEPMLSVTIKQGVIRQQDLLADSSKKDSSNLDKSAYKLVQPGDIAYNKMRAWQGAVGVSDYQGIVSPAYVVVRPRKGVNSRYYHYLLRTPAFAKEAERWSYGITSDMWSLRPEHFKLIYACLPPLPEQTAMVRFLDYADRRIRRYIRAKQKLIALLEEQKQAIIHQAVTGQIDVRTGQPYPAYKPSGVEWLGDVPGHWEVTRLKFLADIPSGQVDPRLEEHRHKVLIAPNHVTPGGGGITNLETANAQSAESGKYEIRVGDVVYSKIRPNLRKAAISPVDGLCSADMYPLRVKKHEINPSFFLRLLLSNAVTRYTVDCSMRVAMPQINREALGACWLSFPRMPEQMEILDWIGIKTASSDVLIQGAQQEIALLREYRTRLIADVVTGKRDVREAAAVLPEVDPLAADDELDEPIDEDAEADSDGLEAIPEGVEA